MIHQKNRFKTGFSCILLGVLLTFSGQASAFQLGGALKAGMGEFPADSSLSGKAIFGEVFAISDEYGFDFFKTKLYMEAGLYPQKTAQVSVGINQDFLVIGPRYYSLILGVSKPFVFADTTPSNLNSMTGFARVTYTEELMAGLLLTASLQTTYPGYYSPSDIKFQAAAGLKYVWNSEPPVKKSKFDLINLDSALSKTISTTYTAPRKKITLEELRIAGLSLPETSESPKMSVSTTNIKASLLVPPVIKRGEIIVIEKNFPANIEISRVNIKIDNVPNKLYSMDMAAQGNWKTTLSLDPSFKEPLCSMTFYIRTKQWVSYQEKIVIPVD